MRTGYKTVVWIIALLGVSLSGFSQDVGFSQFYEQPLLRNPALAGIFSGDIRFTASYRNQWQSVTIPYRTFALSSELKIPLNVTPDDNLTIGLQLIRDVAGTSEFSSTQILPAANYSLPVGRIRNSYLNFAVMGGLMQQRFDPTKLVLNDQFIAGGNGTFSFLPSSRQVFNNTSVNYPDLSMGVSFSSDIGEGVDYFIGIGFFHLPKLKVGFFDGHEIIRNKKVAINAGLSAPTSDEDRIIFYADYFKQFKKIPAEPVGIHTFQTGILYSHDLMVYGDMQYTFTGGVLYRLNDAVVPVIQLQLSKVVIGASYDINIDKLAAAARYRGGIELIITYRDFLNYNQSEQRQSRCPKFRL